MPRKLPLAFFRREDTLEVARDILGKVLIVPDEDGRRVAGRVVEVEAYLGEEDRAAHSFGGRRTARTEIMYGSGGTAYVFFVYGMYNQFNVVIGPKGKPHVLLIRALEPLEGLERMRERRGKQRDRDLTSGPGKLCIAMGIDRSFYGEGLRGPRIWFEDAPPLKDEKIVTAKRVGIDYAREYAHKPWRYYERDNPFVSKTR